MRLFRCFFVSATLLWLGGSVGHAQVAPADPTLPADKILAEGPIPVTIYRDNKTLKKKDEIEAILWYITTEKVYYRTKTSKRTEAAAPGDFITSVKAADGKNEWLANPKTHLFEGPKVVPVNLRPNPAAVPLSKADRERLFFHYVEYLYRELVQAGTSDVSYLKKHAATFAEMKSLPDDIRQAYRYLADTVELRGKRDAERQRVYEAFEKQVQSKNAGLEGVRKLNDLREWLDLCTAIRDDDPLQYLEGNPSRLLDASKRSGAILEAFRLQSEELSGDLTKANEGYDRVENDAVLKLHKLGHDRFDGLAPEAARRDFDLIDRLWKDLNMTGYRRVLLDLSQAAPANVVLRVESNLVLNYMLAANPMKHAAEMREAVRENLTAIRSIPGGADYDPIRNGLMFQTCHLAFRAATVELLEESWKTAYNPNAMWAVRLCDDFMSRGGLVDTSGSLEEMRAWALFQAGRPADALEQAMKVAPLRTQSASYHYNLARVQSSMGYAKKSLVSLEHAVKTLRYSGITHTRGCEDFAYVRSANETNVGFSKLIHLSFLASPSSGGKRIGEEGSLGGFREAFEDIILSNTSAFDFTNVNVTVDLISRTGKRTTYVYSGKLERLRAGEDIELVGMLRGAANTVRGTITVKCDQGKFVQK